MPPTDLETAFVLLASGLSRAQRQLGGSLSIHGIGFSEYLALWHLEQAPRNALRRIDLAEKLGLSASGVTRLVNPMEKIGLVAKESVPHDARVSLVTLTSAGARILAESSTSFRARAHQLLGGLAATDRRAIERIADILTS